MTFRRFIAWIVEKLFELQLFILLLVAVKFVLPTGVGSYASLGAFTAGMHEQWQASLDEAAFMADAYMGNSYLVYALRTYTAAAWVIGIHFYFWSFYLFTSIFACVAGDRAYLRNAVLAFGVSAGVLVWRRRDLFDVQNAFLAGAMLTGGLAVVLASALFGKVVDFRLAGGRTISDRVRAAKEQRQKSVRGRVRFDLSQ